MSGGTFRNYIKTLEIFQKNVIDRIREIRKCLETDKLPLYIIHVHALKSASASVGAEQISEAAKELEQAGRQGNINYIYTHNATFLMDLEMLYHNVNEVLEKEKAKDRDKTINYNLLIHELTELKDALNTLDSDVINKASQILNDFSQAGEFGDAVKTVMQNKLIGDYDAAIAAIDTLLQKLNG
jgi:HPt (histidine-containing phosphotransfer) domain-containing protein